MSQKYLSRRLDKNRRTTIHCRANNKSTHSCFTCANRIIK